MHVRVGALRNILLQQPFKLLTTSTRLLMHESVASLATSNDIPSSTFKDEITVQDIQACSLKYFGFKELRPGQIDVIQAIVCHSQDSLVLWATGAGKSLCYQLPALLLNKTVLVVSPLISLMNDQVIQLNNKIPTVSSKLHSRQIACYLGSAQKDASVEHNALNGQYLIVYLTPEKLCSSGFLTRLESLYASNQIALLAVDEAHCTSEWGNDFRKEYSRLSIFRDKYPDIPIMALTATAVDRVTNDIKTSLQLLDPYVSISNLDRTNLEISVVKKESFTKDIRVIYKHLTESTRDIHGNMSSCIIYVPTKDKAEELCGSLSAMMPDIDISFYHGSVDSDARDIIHKSFLVGSTRIIVATIAFGMGIDKPDIRSVIHYGAPSSMEAYLQHIGRAGRDGYPSTCLAIVSDSDFSNYNSEFYTKNKSPAALEASKTSMEFLQTYCNDLLSCRRKSILSFFNQSAPYDRCGTCDTCRRLVDRQGDVERDFSIEARMLMTPLVGQTYGSSASKLIESVVKSASPVKAGISGRDASSTSNSIQSSSLSKLKTAEMKKDFFKSILPLLVNAGLLKRESNSMKRDSMSRSIVYDSYSLTAKGNTTLLQASASPIILPIPHMLSQLEEHSKRERVLNIQSLIDAGIDVSAIPVEEMELGRGEILDMHIMWSRYIRKKKEEGKTEVVEQMEAALGVILEWRNETAVALTMAPSAVIEEHVAMKIAYTGARTEDDLIAAGVRIIGIEKLVSRLAEVRPKYAAPVSSQVSSGVEGRLIVVPERFKASGAWKHAIFKPAKGANVPLWKLYAERHVRGETLLQMAMRPEGNKASILPATVLSHVLTALLFGETVNLRRLLTEAESCQESSTPTVHEWELFDKALIELNIYPSDTPEIFDYSNIRSIASQVFDSSVVDKETNMKTPEESRLTSCWLGKVRWYLHLKAMEVKVE